MSSFLIVMKMKELFRRSTKIMAAIIVGGGVIGMIVDIGSQILSGSTDNLLMNIAGWLVFIGFVAIIWHATILHIDAVD